MRKSFLQYTTFLLRTVATCFGCTVKPKHVATVRSKNLCVFLLILSIILLVIIFVHSSDPLTQATCKFYEILCLFFPRRMST
jgi:hypothetical protein